MQKLKRWLGFAIFVMFLTHAPASAQEFTVGASIGLPFVELRAGYETPDFGVRAYLAYGWFLGVDAYKITGANEWGSAVRLGIGAGYVFGTGILDGAVIRAVIGGQLFLGAGQFLTLEWRPTYFLSPVAWQGENGIAAFYVGVLTFSLGFEYHF